MHHRASAAAPRPARRVLATTFPFLLAIGAAPFFTARVAHAQGTVTFGGSASADPATPAAPAAPAPDGPAAGANDLPAGDVPADADQAVADEWAIRDRQINEANTLTGSTGLLRTQSAQTGAAGQFRLGFTSEWFSAGFLCSTSFPCPSTANGPITSDTMNHVGATISLGVTLARFGAEKRGALDAYIATGAFANSDTANKPSLLQVLGDTDLGAKFVYALSPVFHYGASAELWLINGTGAVGLDGSGTSAKFTPIILTADLRGLQSKVPLRFSANATYSLDNTGDVVQATEQARGTTITRIERFGLGINRVDHIDIRVGGELLVAEERVRPFVEYSIMAPVGYNSSTSFICNPSPSVNVSGDHCLANDKIAPQTLTIGGRFYPWKHGFSLLAALDIGLAGTSDFIEEVAPTAPWTLYIGAGWAVDTKDRPPVTVTKTVEKQVEVIKTVPRGKVVGFVHETGKQDPIVGAVASYDGHPEMTALVSGADGKFSDELPEGDFNYIVKADGYKPGTCGVKVPKVGGELPVDCALEALPKVGSIAATLRDSDNNTPLSGVSVKVVDPQRKELALTSDGSGLVKVDNLPPGMAQFTITTAGYLTLVQTVEVKARQTTTVELLVHPVPKNAAVVIGAKEITIKQQIQFALDSSTILPTSFGLMTEIADAFIKNPRIRKVEVQGHTDNTGSPGTNKILSEQRADAVVQWLIQHGVPAERLVAKGFGQERPLVPNVTAGNRARNRRVQFVILEQDKQ
jgi:outer membrane protein OmpA-like peptidoglycan-associated protein